MKSAQLLHHHVARSHMEMIGVGKLDLGSDLLQIGGGYRALNGRHGSHIHEHRRLYRTVYSCKFGTLGAAVFL